MSEQSHPAEHEHQIHKIGWLRASVLGANDGLLSTASLIVGVAAGKAPYTGVVLAGVAGLVAGAMAMAAGEFVSVSSQADTERADLEKEAHFLREHPEYELAELTQIYVDRGVSDELAAQVAAELTEADALGTHARDELGISDHAAARPVQAAFASAGSFSVGAFLPLMAYIVAPGEWAIAVVIVATLLSLIGLGSLSAHIGGAGKVRAATRVTFWGMAAMAVTAFIGHLFGTVV